MTADSATLPRMFRAPQDEAPSTRGRLRRRVLWIAAGLLVVIGLGNLAIYGGVIWARQVVPSEGAGPAVPIGNFRVIQDGLWRGGAPGSPEAYEALAASDVVTVVDLRYEATDTEHEWARAAGMDVVTLPIRDGQIPSATQVERFREVIDGATGTVFVHCQAGVGRTGSMIGAYLVSTGQAPPDGALTHNLAVGPPSLEQIAFVASTERGEIDRPPLAVVVASRVLDAPRRMYSVFKDAVL